MREAITGHWVDEAGKVYLRRDNHQYDFTLLCEAIRKLRYDELQLAHLYVADLHDGVDPNLFVDGMVKSRV